MCLTTIIERSTTIKRSGTGYKVFNITLFGLTGPFQGREDRELPVGQWINEKDFRGPEGYKSHLSYRHVDKRGNCLGGKYPYGWHIYVSKTAANNRSRVEQVIKKVRYRQARTLGRQDGVLIVVAKEMFIESPFHVNPNFDGE
jgi:hypothetical protein